MATNSQTAPSDSILAEIIASQVALTMQNTLRDSGLLALPSQIKTLESEQKSLRESGLLEVPAQIKSLKSELVELGSCVNFIEDSCAEAVSKSTQFEARIQQLEATVDNLSLQLTREKEARLKLEIEVKKWNLKITGLKGDQSSGKSLLTYVTSTLETAVGFPCETTGAYRVGTAIKGSRPVIVAFSNMETRWKVLAARKDLEKHGLRAFEDLPPETESNIKEVFPSFVTAKKRGLNAKLKRDELYLNGQKYTAGTLHRLPQGLRPEDISQRENANTILFWGKASPLSNFYSENNLITEGDLSFSSCEQYINAAKAKLFDDDEALSSIMSTNDPVQQKRTKVRNFNQAIWKDSAYTIIKEGVLLKFTQNPHLSEILLKTGSKTLAESSPHDGSWGTGISIREKHAFDRDRWGQNLLGIILMEVRDSLTS